MRSTSEVGIEARRSGFLRFEDLFEHVARSFSRDVNRYSVEWRSLGNVVPKEIMHRCKPGMRRNVPVVFCFREDHRDASIFAREQKSMNSANDVNVTGKRRVLQFPRQRRMRGGLRVSKGVVIHQRLKLAWSRPPLGADVDAVV